MNIVENYRIQNLHSLNFGIKLFRIQIQNLINTHFLKNILGNIKI
jgi:hypothetical protein